jgi:hypothetical protein
MAPETAHERRAFGTQRTDLWWVEPAVTFALLAGFVVYATFRVFEGIEPATRFFVVDNGSYHYLSPFGTPDFTPYVPQFMKDLAGALPLVGPLGVAMLANPAFLVLPLPAGFRFTCYYYRKAYYRSFVARPAACGVEAVKGKKYRGEKRLLILQNVHRYFLYLAILVLGFLTYDAARGIYTPHGWYFGIGNVIMIANVVLLAGYTFGCHSFRHLMGGNLDCFSCDAISQTRYTIWQRITMLNQRHMFWAMASLISVALTDLYIRYIGQNGITHFWGIPA